MGEGSRKSHLPVLIALLTANAVMSISQTNMASIYLPISEDFHSGVTGLGLLSSVYFAGYGIFEVPGGILGAKFGPRRMALIGGVTTTIGLGAGALAPNFDILIASRVLSGIGFGLLWPPILVLIIRNLGKESVGVGTALATISFSVGGAFGVLGWSVLSAAEGWRYSLLVEFILTLAAISCLALVIPRDELSPEFKVKMSQLREVFTDRPTLALAVAIFGGGATASLAGSFLVYYLEETFGAAAAQAGLIGSVIYVTPLVTSLLAGRSYDRGVGAKVLLGLAGLAATIGTAMIAYHSIDTAVLGAAIVGLSIGMGGTIFFSVARDLAPSPAYEGLLISLVDSASLGGLFVGPLYFSYIVLDYGYPTAWVVGSLTAVAFLFPVLFVKFNRKKASPGPVI